MSLPLIIEEVTGPKRSITLRGRSLPYQEVSWGGEQRVNINFHAGNPVATAQVVGPTYKPTVLKGTWKDTFLNATPAEDVATYVQYEVGTEENSPILLNFPSINIFEPGTVGGATFTSGGSVEGSKQQAKTARAVRDAFELIRRSGQLLRVEWGSLVRYGYLTNTTFTHTRGAETDIGWELEFEWIGDTHTPPRVTKSQTFEPLNF